MIQGTYNFPDVVSGDTAEATDFVFSINGVPLNLTGSTIKMDYALKNGSPVKRFTTADNSIVIKNATSGILEIVKYQCTLDPGIYYYDLEITLPTGDKKTYIRGTITVLPEVTK